MTDLDTALRTMLRERADDISAVPAHLTGSGGLDGLVSARHRHTTRWLVAASVIAVLALAGVVVAVRGTASGSDHVAGPGRTGHPASSSPYSSTASVAPPVPATRSSLLRFTADVSAPAGYAVRERSVNAESQTFSLVRNGDHLTKRQALLSHSSVYVVVFAPGRFDVSTLTHRTPTSVGGDSGYFGSGEPAFVPALPSRLATLAWQYAPQSWALVQARTPATQQHSELLRLAAATRTGVTRAISMPLRIRGSVPAGYTVTDGAVGYDGEFDRMVDVSNHPPKGDATDFSIMISSATTDHSLSEPGRTITVDGRSGKLWGSGTNASFRIGSRVIGFNVGGPAYTPTMLQKFLAGVRWSSDPADTSTWFAGTTLLD